MSLLKGEYDREMITDEERTRRR